MVEPTISPASNPCALPTNTLLPQLISDLGELADWVRKSLVQVGIQILGALEEGPEFGRQLHQESLEKLVAI